MRGLTRLAWGCRAYGTPSYYVQRLFAKDAGVKYADTQVAIKPTPPIHNDYVAAAATCIDSECTKVCLKVRCLCLWCTLPNTWLALLAIQTHNQPSRIWAFCFAALMKASPCQAHDIRMPRNHPQNRFQFFSMRCRWSTLPASPRASM